ncbi:Uncharacterized conserved protein YbjT, contains NAD(P)-binding and DUF2867 domains [Aquimarina amphilecti]|uniref:Uncharacterized conserved protein YbjT, contains NAD(P)-binding and DUF2867 domains n=1 Tax=Aquimarina amphilecti TaxID=1038014 RepID=A0A1H7KAQ2_AQUAM|nr:NmrA family NAD(P)-binding protein [Aquimarina amphilecti]SEK83580.1 Uncharacterized conserved protein YbjT, contains NAD(P)-binding and DUF2867 domains [Aquimarina amphilecti]
MSTYFITGAAGTIGSEVIHSLTAKGEKIIAASRTPEKTKDLFNNSVTAVHFDYENEKTYNSALNSDGIFVLGPPLNLELYELLEPFINYLQDNNYEGKIVYLSGNGMENLESLPFHKKMEEKFKNSTLNWNVVRPSFFMQNFANYERENILDRAILFSPAGEGKSSFVSSRDIGTSISALLLDKNKNKETHVLTGSKSYTHYDVAAILSDILEKKITYANPDEETYKKVLKDSGAPDFIAEYMIPVYGMIKNGSVENITTSIKDLTGSDPESLEDVLIRDFK